MFLSMVKPGKKVKLLKIRGGCSIQSKLSSLGLVPGSIFKIFQNDISGALILIIKESRIVLGRGVAHKIEIEEI